MNTNFGFILSIEFSLLQFHLSVDAITKCAITKSENLATGYLKKWLGFSRSATRAILCYPDVCYPSVSQVSKRDKIEFYLVSVQPGIPTLAVGLTATSEGMNIYKPKLLIIILCPKLIHNHHHFLHLALLQTV